MWMREVKMFLFLVGVFALFFFLPFDHPSVQNALLSGFSLLSEYAREHVLLCLVPAFFVAGTIAALVNRDRILKWLGPDAKKWISFPLAASAGGILSVCSCTILPLFGGIYRRGAGLGPATAFLFTGPAINVTAIFLTANALGWELSGVRLAATILSGIAIGAIMQGLFREKGKGGFQLHEEESSRGGLVLAFLGLQLAFLVIGGLPLPTGWKTGFLLLSFLGALLLAFRFSREKRGQWLSESWEFAKKILPLLFVGVFAAGIISSSLPESVVQPFLGGNRLFSTFFASVFGALMYFATLTEVPIVQSLMQLGMGKGPALSLFMAGYTLSIPNMIVLTRLLGKKKAFTYFALVIVFSTAWGWVYGNV